MFLAMVFKPFIALGCLTVAIPFKRAVQRMKDGKIKRFLLISW